MSPGLYDRMTKKLAEQDVPTGPFDVTLTGCGKFGRDHSMNIFWIGIGRSGTLGELYEFIENTLASIGIEREIRPFKPHITVARNKKNFNFKSFYDLIDRYGDSRIVQFPVTGFQVFKSTLTPDGPIYDVLKEIPLTAAELKETSLGQA
jgi:2'-5' RNA ligase